MEYKKLKKNAKRRTVEMKPKSQVRNLQELIITNPKRRQNTRSRVKRKIILSVNKDTKKTKPIDQKIRNGNNSIECLPKVLSKICNFSRPQQKPIIIGKPQILRPVIETTVPNSSLFSLLQHYNLHQYYDQLISLGFEDNNPHIQLLNIQNRRNFTNNLSLMPGHNNRFLRMFSNLEKSFPRDEFYSKFCGPNKENNFQNNVIFAEKYTEVLNSSKPKNLLFRNPKAEDDFSNYFQIKDFCGNTGYMMVDGRVATSKSSLG